MFQKPCVGLEEAQRALAAVIENARRDGSRPAVAIVDDQGELVCFGRMDGAPISAQRAARRKAYTAAIMRMETSVFRERMEERGRSLADYGDSSLTTLQGGLPVFAGESLVAGVGVAGTPPARDIELARLAADVLARAAG